MFGGHWANGSSAGCFSFGDVSDIPDEWIAQVACKDWIKGLCDEFENKLSK